jgi:hypothetical protein
LVPVAVRKQATHSLENNPCNSKESSKEELGTSLCVTFRVWHWSSLHSWNSWETLTVILQRKHSLQGNGYFPFFDGMY